MTSLPPEGKSFLSKTAQGIIGKKQRLVYLIKKDEYEPMSENILAPQGVLFVCTGNICRSPTAEAVFRHQVEAAGMSSRFFTDSAGTHGYHIGDPPDPRSVSVAAARGVDMRDLRARKVQVSDFSRFHYIVAMDSGHYTVLERLKPATGGGALSLFRTFEAVDGPALDVPDPYYGGQADFEQVYDLIEGGCRNIISILAGKVNLR